MAAAQGVFVQKAVIDYIRPVGARLPRYNGTVQCSASTAESSEGMCSVSDVDPPRQQNRGHQSHPCTNLRRTHSRLGMAQ